MPLTQDPTDDGHWAIISLRLTGILTSIPVVIGLAWAANVRGSSSGDASLAGAFDYILLAGALFTLLYSFITLNVRLCLRRPVYPGVFIGFDLVAFAILLTMTTVFWLALQPYKSDSYDCSGRACADGTLRGVEYASGILALVDCAVHLGVFCWACWACRRYGKSEKDLTSSC